MSARVYVIDRAEDVARLADRLVDHLEEGNLVVERGGEADTIRRRSGKADVVVILIGPHWAPHRLASPDDPVRQLLEAGVEAELGLLPVLVEGGALPAAGDLPASLHPILDHHVATLRARDPGFTDDVTALRKRIRSMLWRKVPYRTELLLLSVSVALAGFALVSLALDPTAPPLAPEGSSSLGKLAVALFFLGFATLSFFVPMLVIRVIYRIWRG